MNNHLYEDAAGTLHLCEMSQLFPRNMGEQDPTVLVWTKCEKDVPANKSFTSVEAATCQKCLNETKVKE